MKSVNDVITNLDKGKNIIFFNKNVYSYYELLKDSFDCIYLNEPVPLKLQLIKILNTISGYKRLNLNRMTISDLKEKLVEELEYKVLVVMFNHFERLTKKAVEVYEYLNSVDNIVFVASFNNRFKKEAYPFFKKFIFLNKAEYYQNNGNDEIDVTYAMYFVICVLCFALYIKFAHTLYSESVTIAIVAMGALWFTFLLFRTLIFAGGRV